MSAPLTGWGGQPTPPCRINQCNQTQPPASDVSYHAITDILRKMLILKQFCGFDIRTGGVMIGWLNLAICVYKIISMLIEMLYDPIPTTSSYTSITEYYKNLFRFNVYYQIGAILVFLIVNVTLLYGIHKNNKIMLVPWLVLKMIAFAFLTLLWIIVITSLIVWNETLIAIVIFIFGLPLCGLPWHCWRCVFTLYNTYSIAQLKLSSKKLQE